MGVHAAAVLLTLSLVVTAWCDAETCAATMTAKAIKTVIPAQRPHWVGNGFHVFPVFGPLAFTEAVSPFLMLDYAAPRHFEATHTKRGVGQHPHRGFETVTIAFQGEVEHRDSTLNHDVIGEGDVQWMTAARGIVHEEFHSERFRKEGGKFEMIQLWVNLPKAHKMSSPKYQAILSSSIPQIPLPQGKGHVRVIAGSFQGSPGPASTFTPLELWDVKMLSPGVPFDFDLPDDFNAMVFVRKGSLRIKGQKVGPQGVVLLDTEGTHVSVTSDDKDTQLLMLAGEPLREPIAARGPFVMNTEEELTKAIVDFHSGNFAN